MLPPFALTLDLVLIGFGLSFALVHLTAGLGGRFRAAHLSFSILCVASVLQILADLLNYAATAPGGGRPITPIFFLALGCSSTARIWFVTFFAEIKSRWFSWAYSLAWLVLTVLYYFFPGDEARELQRAAAGAGSEGAQAMSLTALEVATYLVGLASYAYGFWAARLLFARGEHRSAAALAGATGLRFVLVSIDVGMVAFGSPALFLSDISLVAYVIIMGQRLQGERSEAERELEEANTALRVSEERFALAVDGSSDGIWDWDVASDTLLCSDRYYELLGYAGRASEPMTAMTALIHPDDSDRVAHAMEAHLSDRVPLNVEYRNRCADGEYRWFSVRGQAIWDELGSPSRVTGSLRDIDRQVRGRAERERLIKELAVRNAELQQFTYTVSHDLKSPLVTIGSYTGLARRAIEKGNTERALSDLERMAAATGHMQSLLQDLLELSRIGQENAKPQPLDMYSLAKEAVSLLAGAREEWSGEITIDPHLPVATGDPKRILQLIQNLVENAIRYSNESEYAVVNVSFHAGETPVYSVKDNGIGIDQAGQEQIFGLFTQLDPRGVGTGIGLAICRRIVETHDGRIWVESEGRGRGTEFLFTLGASSAATQNHEK